MSLVSGGSSRLNPNAPLYIPAAVRQVEDFSPEWYDLISTSTWFRNYWLSQHQEASNFYKNKVDDIDNNDIVDMLPDDIDLGVEEVSSAESRFLGFSQPFGHQGTKNIFANDGGASMNLGVSRGPFPSGSRFAAQPWKFPERAN